MMTTDRGLLSKTVAGTMAVIESAIPALVMARDLMDQFHSMIKRRAGADLDDWINDATSGLLGSFAKGIVQDRAAVHAALTQLWSNGQTDGQNTKLKLIKRQMYGRANLDILRARLLGAA
jgi:transposase